MQEGGTTGIQRKKQLTLSEEVGDGFTEELMPETGLRG